MNSLTKTEGTGDWHVALLESLRNCGVQRESVSELRRVLVGLAMFCVAIFSVSGLHIIKALIPPADRDSPGVSLTYLTIVVPTLTWLLNRIRDGYRRMKARSALELLQESGAKRPTFYLRSFRLDEDIAKPTFFQRFFPLANAEQKATAPLRKLGPVITIGRPGEKLPLLGAARFYVSEELWRAKVADVVKASQLVLWATGITEGLRWEISHLIENLAPEKLVLWAHPHLLRVSAQERESEWTIFRRALGNLFPKPLPEVLGDTRLICFASDWTPSPIAPRWRGPATALRSLFSPLYSTARTVLRIKQGKLDARAVTYTHALRDTAESSFRDLIGVGYKVRWSHMIVFAVAEAAAGISYLLVPLVRQAFRVIIRGDFSTLPERIATLPARIAETARLLPWKDRTHWLLFATLEVTCICVGFRVVRSWKWAAVTSAAAYALVTTALLSREDGGARLALGGLLDFSYVSAEVLALAFAVGRYKPLAKALWIGSFAAWYVGWAAAKLEEIVFGWFWLPSYHVFPLEFLTPFITSVVFALVFWVGIRMTGDVSLGGQEPARAVPTKASL